MKDLLKKNWKYWRGKAGSYAKHKNDKLEFCNYQKLRYFNKWARLEGFEEDLRIKLIESKFI